MEHDHCTVDEALERCKAAGVPEPSSVVSSGNGVHLYWLLAEPYLIDDVDDPPQVFTEFINQGEGQKKKVRKFIKNGNEKIYIDGKDKRNAPPLSPKAQYVQDILGGIASKIDGDHTTDLSRLLRVPGTLNRKDQRNGREPVPCTLVNCDPGRRYPIADFAQYAKASPDRARRETIAKVKLPAARKLTATKLDRLQELLLTCGTAEVGARSEADFALCCWAVEHGMTRESLWVEAQAVGKFAEAGERYFDRTWEKAEGRTRQKIFDKVQEEAERKNTPTKDEVEEPGRIKTLADAICLIDHFARDGGGRLYRYRNGVFRPDGEQHVKVMVKSLLTEWSDTKKWSSRLASEVAEFIRVDAPELPDRPRMDLVNVENGMIRVVDGVLLPHDQKYLSCVQLPVKFAPAATCPNIEAFVAATFPRDAFTLAWEIPGLLMIPATWLQKAVLLLGEGANGKSVWLAMLMRFLGKANVAAIPLHRLEADKFVTARLVGKLANICPDLPSEHLAGTSVFKSIVGGDSLPAEHKFKDSFDVTPFVRLVFSANHPPRSSDSSAAFFRRWVVIPFDHTFAQSEQIPRDVLDGRLQTPEELSGLLNKALEGLRRVQQQRGFSEPASVQAAWRDFHATTDPLAVWLDRYTIDDPDTHVTKQALRVAYNAAVERDGRPAMTAKAFGQAIYKLRPNIEERQRMVGGRYQWCYIGIGLTSQDDTRNTLDARDHPLSFARKLNAETGKGDSREKIIEAYPVHPVHPVDCFHDWVDSRNGDGRVKRTCKLCGGFYGYVQKKESKQ